jgi:hypothetical protein
MMGNREVWLYITYGLLALFWLPAYILIARRGFMEKTYGMPIVAMLGNWAWEWIYALNLDSACPVVWSACPKAATQLASFASMFLDGFIVFTIFKYGREKFTNPFIRKYFDLILIFGLITSFAIQYAFVTEVGFPNIRQLTINNQVPSFLSGDGGGSYTPYVLIFALGILLIYTLFRLGRRYQSNVFFQRYLGLMLICGMLVSFAFEYFYINHVQFPSQYQFPPMAAIPDFLPGDEGGSYSAYILTFAMGLLFINMLTERNSLEGQSFIIAMAMLLGNVAAYIFIVLLSEQTPFLNILFYLTLFVNIVYAVMTYQKSIELGINPWTRW